LRELCEVEYLERIVYGEKSVSLGKTLKIIGTLQIIAGETEKAKQSLVEAR